MVREGLIEVWTDRAVAAGADWEQSILSELAAADIVILLVTPDFVASAYCFEIELPEALRRNREDGLRVLPIHVKAVDLPNLPFGKIQGLPTEMRPITAWPDADEAWLRVAQGVRTAAEDILRTIPRQRTEPADKSRLGQDLQAYYGSDNCVVDGPTQDIEWIPLNEDIDDLRFDNLVPLARRHRTRPYAAGFPHRAVFRFGIDLVAENLFHRARRHFHAGLPALAYGCARLGDVLAVCYPYAFEAHDGDDWAFLAQSLFYLPYRMHPELLEATLKRARERLLADGDCPSAGRVALLLAVANLYQDTGDWAKAEELYDAVLAGHPSAAIRVAAVRRRAVGRIFLGPAADGDLLRAGGYKANTDLAVSLAVAQGWLHLANGRPEQCLRQLEPFNFDEDGDGPYSPHNAVEFKLTQASALIALGLSCGSQLRFIKRQSMALRPVFTEYIAPLLLARELREVVEPFASPIGGYPDELDATADALLATKVTPVAGRPVWVD